MGKVEKKRDDHGTVLKGFQNNWQRKYYKFCKLYDFREIDKECKIFKNKKIYFNFRATLDLIIFTGQICRIIVSLSFSIAYIKSQFCNILQNLQFFSEKHLNS